MTTDLPLVSSFGELILSFAPVFSQPSFANFTTLIAGWVFCMGRRTVTGLITAAGAIGKKHFSCYHRFFSRAVWDLDSLGQIILKLALCFIPKDAVILLAVDDTLARKTGKRIWGAAMHHDPLRSTRRKHFFSFGHSWVVLSLVIELPFAKGKYFALPFLFRLYRKKKKKLPPGRPKGERKQCGEATAKEYRTRPELAVEMLEIAAQWLPGRRIRVVGDSEYSGKSVSRELPERADLVGRMPMDAALYDKPGPRKPHQRGPNRKKGERLANPAQLAASRKVRWTKTTVDIYGRTVKICFKTMRALWYGSAGERPVTVVVTRDPSGRWRDDCFFTTDLTMKPTEVVETIALRWSLEVTFRDAKQALGFEEPQNRTPKAVERTSPVAMVLYSATVLWYARAGSALRKRWFPQRPWYSRKKRRNRTASFAVMLATLRQASWMEMNLGDPIVREGSMNKAEKRILQLQQCLLTAA
jgi:SRSO17 transposase